MAGMNEELRAFLLANVYRNYRITRMWNKAKRALESVFGALESAPEQLPPSAQSRIAEDGLARAICDYLAGLTDREAVAEHRRLFEVGQSA